MTVVLIGIPVKMKWDRKMISRPEKLGDSSLFVPLPLRNTSFGLSIKGLLI